MRDWQRQYRLSKERWHYQVIRLDHDDAQMLRTLAEREGTTVPELVRTFVVWGWRSTTERVVLNLNRANLSLEPINTAINSALERIAAPATERLREQYLGASILGHECLRRIQYEWWCKAEHSAQERERFRRGDYFEERMRQHLVATGFKFAPREAWAFTAVGGVLRGHCDGIIIHGPDLLGAYVIYPLIWEHKCLKATSYREIQRDGLEKETLQLPRTGRALPGVPEYHQSRAVHRHERRHLRVVTLLRPV
jgi:hypothetical protein